MLEKIKSHNTTGHASLTENMKKTIFTILFSFTYLISFAQSMIPVTIIKTDGSKLKCHIATYEGKVISSFNFKIWVNDEKMKIDRKEIKEIITNKNKYVTIEYIKETRRGGQITKKKTKRTAELLINDKVKLFAVHSVMSSSVYTFNNTPISSGSYLATSHYLASDNTTYITKTNFKKTIKKYFSDCGELNLKIKSKELNYGQIKEVITMGNLCLKN